MGLIGLELNDSGILAAAGDPPELMDLDGPVQESPGFALPQKKGLLVGKTAESKAHYFPRQILNHFWDQLNTDPLKKTGRHLPNSHAEIVFHHLVRRCNHYVSSILMEQKLQVEMTVQVQLVVVMEHMLQVLQLVHKYPALASQEIQTLL